MPQGEDLSFYHNYIVKSLVKLYMWAHERGKRKKAAEACKAAVEENLEVSQRLDEEVCRPWATVAYLSIPIVTVRYLLASVAAARRGGVSVLVDRHFTLSIVACRNQSLLSVTCWHLPHSSVIHLCLCRVLS